MLIRGIAPRLLPFDCSWPGLATAPPGASPLPFSSVARIP